MKRRQLSVMMIILLLSVGGFIWYIFQNSPKKIAANAIYHLDKRILQMADDFFFGMGLYDMVSKLEAEGGYTMSYDGARYHNYYNERTKFIYTSDPNNQKSEMMYQMQQGDKRLGYSEKIIGGKAYLYLPNIFRSPIMIDTNTMSSLADGSAAAQDLIFDFHNHNLFRPPLTLLQIKRFLKGSIAKDWSALLSDTQVKRIAKQKYEIVLKGKDVENLLKGVQSFLEENQNPLYHHLFPIEQFYQLNGKDLTTQDKLVLMMETDEKDALTKIYDQEGRYMLSLQDGFALQLPSFQFHVTTKQMEDQNVAVGNWNDHRFVLTYDYKTPKIVTVLDEGTVVTNFTLFEPRKAFNTVTTFENSYSSWQHLRFHFYARPKDVQPQGNYVEILKLSPEDWNRMKNDAVNRQGFPGYVFKEEKE